MPMLILVLFTLAHSGRAHEVPQLVLPAGNDCRQLVAGRAADRPPVAELTTREAVTELLGFLRLQDPYVKAYLASALGTRGKDSGFRLHASLRVLALTFGDQVDLDLRETALSELHRDLRWWIMRGLRRKKEIARRWVSTLAEKDWALLPAEESETLYIRPPKLKHAFKIDKFFLWNTSFPRNWDVEDQDGNVGRFLERLRALRDRLGEDVEMRRGLETRLVAQLDLILRPSVLFLEAYRRYVHDTPDLVENSLPKKL